MKRIHSLLAMATMMELILDNTNFGISEYPSSSKSFRSNRSKHSLGRSKMRTEAKISRNAICPHCDSGLKFKKCCGK